MLRHFEYSLISYYQARPDGSHMNFRAPDDAAARKHAADLIASRGETASFDSAWELLRCSGSTEWSLGFFDDEGNAIEMQEE